MELYFVYEDILVIYGLLVQSLSESVILKTMQKVTSMLQLYEHSLKWKLGCFLFFTTEFDQIREERTSLKYDYLDELLMLADNSVPLLDSYPHK